jgi:N utilization substance protein A
MYQNHVGGTTAMNSNIELFDALALVAKEKGISAEVLVEKIQTALVIAIKKDYPRSEDINFDIDITKGKFDVCINKEIVETPEEIFDDANQIDLESAKKISKKYKIGDKCVIKLNTRHFGRIAAQTAKQVIKQGIKEVERDQLIEQWGNLQNEAMSVKVIKVEPDTGNAIVEVNSAEVTLFKNDQIPGEPIFTGDNIKVYISGVSANDRRPTLRISRTHNNLVRKLLETEVPEIYDGIVEVRAISREAGIRSKIAVISNDDNVDAVGSCIGPGRSRIQGICDELNGEKIDVVFYSDDPKEFIKQALKPADVIDVDIPDEQVRACSATVPDNQLSLAIGNKGQNAKLAARLTGFKIDIRPESGFYEG